jgi:hypothetical protein
MIVGAHSLGGQIDVPGRSSVGWAFVGLDPALGMDITPLRLLEPDREIRHGLGAATDEAWFDRFQCRLRELPFQNRPLSVPRRQCSELCGGKSRTSACAVPLAEAQGFCLLR